MSEIVFRRNIRVLSRPADAPADECWVYGLGYFLQIGPTTVALLANIRLDGTPVDDLEVGSDVVILHALDDLTTGASQGRCEVVPLQRPAFVAHPRTGERLRLAPYLPIGGFVPLGACGPNGRPHPHAGTGFGIATVIGFPADYSARWVGQIADPHMYHELEQYRFDGRRFEVVSRRPFSPADVPDGWEVTLTPIAPAVPDGDDLLGGIVARRSGEVAGAAMARWRRDDGGWRLVELVPVTGADASSEPSLARDRDGSLLFTSRGCYAGSVQPGRPDDSQTVRIWRSEDGGRLWRQVMRATDVRPPSPIVLNATADGRPYVALNPLRWTGERPAHIGAAREFLEVRELATGGHDCIGTTVVRDGPADFGRPPSDSRWCIDHPIGATVRLGDGVWRHLLAYRVMEIGESSGAPPTPVSGLYVAELEVDAPSQAPWLFEQAAVS